MTTTKTTKSEPNWLRVIAAAAERKAEQLQAQAAGAGK